MKFQRKKVATALACVLGLSGAVLAGNALAADVRVDVTGSNIPRTEGETAVPLTVITREDINRTGATSVYDLMSLVSANTSSGNVSVGNVIGATTFSAQTASLRALGGGRTLVLLNGKRLNSFAGEIQGVQGVNLDAIPLSAIERIEVLKDGASAIYGSDAIAGVINFILRSDYQGAEVSGYYGTPTRKSSGNNGDVWNGKLSAGWGDLSKDRFNVFVTGSYEDRKPLLQSERNFSRTSYIPGEGVNTTSGNTFPGFISTGGIGSPDFPNCTPAIGNIRIGSRCRFDPAQYPNVESLPEQKLTHGFASARFQITPDWQAYATGTYSKVETHFIIQPVPISDQFFYGPNGDIPANITIPAGSPFYPTAAAIAAGVNGQPLNVRYRCVLCGNRDTTDTNTAWQTVLGLKGQGWGWDVDVSGIWNEGKTKDHLNGGFPLYSRILPLLRSGNVNLFGPNSDAIAQQVAATNYIGDTFIGKSTNKLIDAKASREIYNLPAGPLAFAIGGEYRKEDLDQNPLPVLATGDLSGFGGNILPVNRNRSAYALFGELSIPILRNLEGNAAVRYDHYSDFGNTTNPKLSLRYQPLRQVVLRSSWGTGFLAPSLYQLFTPNISGVSTPGLTDPIRCPVTRDSNDCDTQFPVQFGGNPSLKPERSEQWTAGFVIEPAPRTSLSLDYFHLNLSDSITNGVSPTVILGDLAQYGGLVTRAPGVGNLPGRIINIDQRYVNLGNIHVEGFDVDARWQSQPFPWGRIRLGINGTYYKRYDVQQTDFTYAGFVSNQAGSATSGVIPRWKHYATIGYDRGPWAFTFAQNFQSTYNDVNTDLNGNDRRVSSLSIFDVQASYTGIRNVTLTAGVRNLFDTNPPFTNQNTTFQVGYDPSYYDPRARFVYGSITWKFL